MLHSSPLGFFFPPYVWIFIKNYLFQEYWNKKYNNVIKDLPQWGGFYLTNTNKDRNRPFYVLTSAAKKIRLKKEFQRCVFPKKKSLKLPTRTMIVYSIYKKYSWKLAVACQETSNI